MLAFGLFLQPVAFPNQFDLIGKRYAVTGIQPSAVQASGHARSSSFRLFLHMRFTYSSLGSFDAPGKSLRGPSCCSGRNPLVLFERKAALEIGLESSGAAPNVPGAVWITGAQQILHSTAVRRAVGVQEPALTQSVQGHAGGMGVAAEIWVACPSAIAPLLGEQRICHPLDCIFPDACRGKSKQL